MVPSTYWSNKTIGFDLRCHFLVKSKSNLDFLSMLPVICRPHDRIDYLETHHGADFVANLLLHAEGEARRISSVSQMLSFRTRASLSYCRYLTEISIARNYIQDLTRAYEMSTFRKM